MRTEVRERIAMIERGEVPDGYENKGNGINPIGWYPYFMGELFDFSGGISASREQLSSNGICYLHYGDIHKTNKTYIDICRKFNNRSNISLQQIIKFVECQTEVEQWCPYLLFMVSYEYQKIKKQIM